MYILKVSSRFLYLFVKKERGNLTHRWWRWMLRRSRPWSGALDHIEGFLWVLGGLSVPLSVFTEDRAKNLPSYGRPWRTLRKSPERCNWSLRVSFRFLEAFVFFHLQKNERPIDRWWWRISRRWRPLEWCHRSLRSLRLSISLLFSKWTSEESCNLDPEEMQLIEMGFLSVLGGLPLPSPPSLQKDEREMLSIDAVVTQPNPNQLESTWTSPTQPQSSQLGLGSPPNWPNNIIMPTKSCVAIAMLRGWLQQTNVWPERHVKY